MKLHQASDVMGHTMREGGGTFNVGNGAPITLPSGYMVGGIIPAVVVDLTERQAHTVNRDIAAFVNANIDALRSHGAYLGTWINDGKLYIDASQWIPDAGRALQVGAERGELAVWDCAAGVEIPTTVQA